jgi:molecular chaperone GrpE
MHNSRIRTNQLYRDDESPEVKRLKDELQREHGMYLRAVADFDNYRRRIERERSSIAQSGKREVLLPLLEQLDSFDRALRHLTEAPPALAEGILALHRNLLNLLEAEGVTPFESVGYTFDPERHDAIGTTSSEEYETGIVVEEAQRGYRWGEEILRPARVKVAR